MSSVFVFFDDSIDLAADEAVKGVVVVAVVVASDVLTVLVASFTVGVAPGIDDNEFPVDAVVGDEGTTGDKGMSGSLGKLSVYNTLAELLHTTSRCH